MLKTFYKKTVNKFIKTYVKSKLISELKQDELEFINKFIEKNKYLFQKESVLKKLSDNEKQQYTKIKNQLISGTLCKDEIHPSRQFLVDIGLDSERISELFKHTKEKIQNNTLLTKQEKDDYIHAIKESSELSKREILLNKKSALNTPITDCEKTILNKLKELTLPLKDVPDSYLLSHKVKNLNKLLELLKAKFLKENTYPKIEIHNTFEMSFLKIKFMRLYKCKNIPEDSSVILLNDLKNKTIKTNDLENAKQQLLHYIKIKTLRALIDLYLQKMSETDLSPEQKQDLEKYIKNNKIKKKYVFKTTLKEDLQKS